MTSVIVPRKGRYCAPSRLVPVLLFLLSGCAGLPDAALELPASSARIELEHTPFFPQERFQCGPAALTTALTMSGVDVALAGIVDKVYLPGREGSLQLELIAATRSSGRLPYVIDGTMAALSEKWFGVTPAPGSAAVTVYTGYGQPGFEGYEATPHVPNCK